MVRQTLPFVPTTKALLNYLPRTPLQGFGKNDIIYDQHRPADCLYLLVSGRVKLSSIQQAGTRIIARILGPEALFGGPSLLGTQECAESAMVMEKAMVMSWPSAAIEQHIQREPSLGIALIQYIVLRSIELQDRIEHIMLWKTDERVMLSLLQLAATLGSPTGDGSTRMSNLTHQMIADYVGTSREMVSLQLNRLRREGIVDYSRKYIDVYIDSLEQILRQQGIAIRTPARMAKALTAGTRL